MVRRLGAVQLDTISVLARSHELVAYARHGAVGRAAVERAYWGKGSATFEYWSHAACVIPLEDWPLYEFKRRARRAKGKRWHDLADRDRSCAEVVAPPAGRRAPDGQRARAGPRSRECGGTGPRRRSPPNGCSTWATWCVGSGEGSSGSTTWPSGPSRPRSAGPSSADEECAVRLVAAAGRSLGLGTLGDLAVYHGLPQRLVRPVLPEAGLVPVRVQGWKPLAYADPAALAAWAGGPRGGACCSPPSTRSVGTGTASNGSSGCATAWRPTRRGTAHLRLLRHARAGRRRDRRAGRSGAPRRGARGQAGHALPGRGRRPRRRRPRRGGALGRV